MLCTCSFRLRVHMHKGHVLVVLALAKVLSPQARRILVSALGAGGAHKSSIIFKLCPTTAICNILIFLLQNLFSFFRIYALKSFRVYATKGRGLVGVRKIHLLQHARFLFHRPWTAKGKMSTTRRARWAAKAKAKASKKMSTTRRPRWVALF